MGQYFAKDSSGLTQFFTIAGDKPTPSEQQQISSILAGKTATPARQPEPADDRGLMSIASNGLGSWWNQIQAGTDLIAADQARRSDTGSFAGYTTKEWEEAGQAQNREAEGYDLGPGFFEAEGAGAKAKSLVGQAVQSAPTSALSWGATLGGAGAGAMFGSAAGPLGTVAGGAVGAGLGFLGSMAASMPQTYNENYQTQIQEHGYLKDPDKAMYGALASSAIEAVANKALLGFSGVLKGVAPGAIKGIVSKATKGAIAKVATTTAAGFTEEATTEAVQQAITRWQAEKPLGDAQAQQEYLESAIVGGLLGGTMAAPLGIVGARQDAAHTAKIDEIEKDISDEAAQYTNAADNVEKNRIKFAKEQDAVDAGKDAADIGMSAEPVGLGEDILTDEDIDGEEEIPLAPVDEAAQTVVAKDVAKKGKAATAAAKRGSPDGTASADLAEPIRHEDIPAFDEEEYTRAMKHMQNVGKMFSANKIKTDLKMGGKKAAAIFKAMHERGDAVLSGSQNKYLKAKPITKSPTVDNLSRSYSVRPLKDMTARPFTVAGPDGADFDTSFATSKEAHDFAAGQNLKSFAVKEAKTAQPQVGVFETVSNVDGTEAIERLVSTHNTEEEARTVANEHDPALSAETNAAVAAAKEANSVKTKAAMRMGTYAKPVQNLVDKILGKNRTLVDLVESITTASGKGIQTGDAIEGMTQGVRKMVIAAGIQNPNMSPDQVQQHMMSVASHEVLHTAKEAGIFTPQEYGSLVSRANQKIKGKRYTYLERAQVRTRGAPKGASIEEEAVAEMVRDYMRDPTAFERAPRSLLGRFIDFVNVFGSNIRDIQQGNNTLKEFTSGSMADRAGDPERVKMYGEYYSTVKIPGFYLKSSKFFEDYYHKDPDAQFSGQKWLGYLKNDGKVAKEELQWLGLDEWLNAQKQVSINEILQYIGANSLDVQETITRKPTFAEDMEKRGLHDDLKFDYDKSGSDEEFEEWVKKEAQTNPTARRYTDLSAPMTYHQDVTQEGGHDYREVVIHMPHLQPQFSEPNHFGGWPNVLATARLKTRFIKGRKVLFIEEMQSDLHQRGGKQGYFSKTDQKNIDDLTQQRADLIKQANAIDAYSREDIKRQDELLSQALDLETQIEGIRSVSYIPDAPFKMKGWSDVVIKRLVRYAVDNGFETIGWNAEPKGVALTEGYDGSTGMPDYTQKMEETIGPDGSKSYNVVIRNDYDDTVERSQDVTGIINFYTQKMTKEFGRIFKTGFGDPTPYYSERETPEQTGSTMDTLRYSIPDEVKFQRFIAKVKNPDMKVKYDRAVQMSINQRKFDIDEIVATVGIDPEQLLADLSTVEGAIKKNTDVGITKAGNPDVAHWLVDVTPEMSTTASENKFAMFEKYSAVKMAPKHAPDNPKFNAWFGDSKVIDGEGNPLVVYHGTLNDFDSFNNARPDAAVGAGFYFTDSAADASYNYGQANGPDPIYKMQQLTDELLNNGDIDDADLDEEGIHQEARAAFAKHEGSVMPVYLAIKNPVVLNWQNSTKLTRQDFAKMVQPLPDLDRDFLNIDPSRIAATVADMADLNYTNAEEVRNELLKNGGVMEAIDPYSGMEAANEVVRRMFEAAGYDGFIMRDVKRRWPAFEHAKKDTSHYIAFKPEQVKSVNNNGNFSSGDKRILYSSVKIQPSYSAVGTFGGRVPAIGPSQTLADIESRLTYNNIAPLLERLYTGAGFARLAGKRFMGYTLPTAQQFSEGTVIALQDKMQPLAKLLDRVRKNGGVVSNDTDPYMNEQLMYGTIDTAIENNKKNVYNPLVDAVLKLNVSEAQLTDLKSQFVSNKVTGPDGITRETNTPLRIIGQYDSPNLAIAEAYLYAQHAKERNALMKKRNVNLQAQRPDQFDHGSGMSDAEADAILQWMGQQPFAPNLMSTANPSSVRMLYRGLISSTNDIRVAGGLNPDFRTMRDANGNPVDTYKDYAPLRGYIDDNPDADPDELTQAFARAGKGMKIMGKEDQSATGRQSEAANLIGNAILQNEEAIVRAEKNKVGQTFLNFLRQNMAIALPTSNPLITSRMKDFAEVVPMTQSKPTYDKKSGVVRMSTAPSRMDPDLMVVKENGKEIGIRIKDRRLKDALLGNTMLGNTGQNGLIKGLLKVNRVLAAVRTTYNPEFMLSNFFRDFEGAMLNLTEQQMKGLRMQIAGDTFKAIRGVYRSLMDKTPNAWSAEFDEFAKYGGRTAALGFRDLQGTLEKVNKQLSTDPKGNAQAIKAMFKAVTDRIEGSNEAIENGIRIATYKHLKDRYTAMSQIPNDPAEQERIKKRAAYAAKNLTVNFNMGGNLKPTMQAMYLFYNASMQGSAALINPLIRSKTVRRMWMSAVAAGAMQDVIMSMLSDVGDDGEKEYDKIPEQVLETNMILFNPFSETGYFKIPMPYLFNAAWNSGRAMMRTARGGYSLGEGVGSVMGAIAEGANPLGGGGHWLNYVAPTIADPFIEVATNKNFMGAPIEPEKSPYGSGDIPSQRYWNNTSPAFVTVANWIDMLTGGDSVLPGAVSYSPNTYEYFFEFAGGGALATVVRAWDFLSPEATGGAGRLGKLIVGDEVSSNDIPFIRRFSGNITSRENTAAYIENRDRVLSVRSALSDATKKGDSAEYQRIMQDYPEEYKLAARINKVESVRRKLSSNIKKIRSNPRLSEDRKKALVDKIKERQSDLVDRANLMMQGI